MNVSIQVKRHNCSESALDRFRWVYQYYLHDPLLRNVRKSHPFIVIFDNHDLDSSRSVNLSLGSIQAFLEYIPVRVRTTTADNMTGEFYRQYRFGQMFDLIALDTRAIGVDIPGDGTYLGLQQREWVTQMLNDSQSSSWRIVLTTVAFAPWAVNGWDVYVNSIFGGVFTALLVLTTVCIGSMCYMRRRRNRQMDSVINDDEDNKPLGNPKRRMGIIKCCVIYGLLSIGILMIIWIASTVIVNQIIAARNLNVQSSGNSLELVAAEDRNWDGHPADRQDFMQRMKDTNTTLNNVWLSGDL